MKPRKRKPPAKIVRPDMTDDERAANGVARWFVGISLVLLAITLTLAIGIYPSAQGPGWATRSR